MGGIEQAAAPVGGVGFPPEIPLGLQPCKLPCRRALINLQALTYLRLRNARMAAYRLNEIKFLGSDALASHGARGKPAHAARDYGDSPLRNVHSASLSRKMIYQLKR